MDQDHKTSACVIETEIKIDDLSQSPSSSSSEGMSSYMEPLPSIASKLPAIKQEFSEDQLIQGKSEEVIVQQSNPRRNRYKWYYLSRDTWFCEILSCAFSFGCLIAIIIILRRFDQKPLPDLKYGITVGALVSLFTTLAVTSLMFPVSRGLSQLKWLHFAGEAKRITDLDKFDQASRGILGSIALLFSAQQRLVSRLGAIVTIVVIASNALTQQAIGYMPYRIHDHSGKASAPRALFFNSYNLYTGQGFGRAIMPATPTYDTMATVMDGVLHDNSTVPFQGLHCSTGNCTWADYNTLGVCSSVADVSHLLIQDIEKLGDVMGFYTTTLPKVTKLVMPHAPSVASFVVRSTGRYLTNFLLSGISSPDYSGEDVKSISFGHLVNSTIADFFVVWSESTVHQPSGDYVSAPVYSRAVEVNLHYCVQQLRSNVHKGEAQTQRIGDTMTDFEYKAGTKLQDYDGMAQISITDVMNENATLTVAGEEFGFNRRAQQSLNTYYNTLFNGSWIIATDADYADQPPHGSVAISMGVIRELLRCYTVDGVGGGCSLLQLHGYMKVFDTYAENMAMILSNRFRTKLAEGRAVQGIAHETIAHVLVSWPWVSPIAVLVVCSLVFLVTVTWLNRRHQVKLWRGSNVALTQAIDPTAHGIYENSAMHVRARKVRMQLDNDSEVWRLARGS